MRVFVGLGHARVGVDLELRLLESSADDGEAGLATEPVVADLPDGSAGVAALLLVDAGIGTGDAAGQGSGGEEAGDESGGQLHGDKR